MPNVLVIGSVNMDVVAPYDRMPQPGESLPIPDVRLIPGGKGANAAVAAARLGAKTKFVGCVGNDPFAAALREGLESNGVDCEHLSVSNRGSGTALILLNQTNAQNSILVGLGANQDLRLPDTDELFAWADILLLQLETPLATNAEAIQRARAAGVTVLLDSAPAPSELPAELLNGPDIISPNETELAILSRHPVDSVEDAIGAAKVLIERGARQLVIKLGEKGSLWVAEGTHQYFPGLQIDPVDTTAAGDAFTAALGVSLAQGLTMNEAIARANAAGALACTKLGAQPSLPRRIELESML